MIKIPYGWLLGYYKKFPNFIQYILGGCLKPFPRSFLLGSGFNEKLQFLMKSEKWPSESLMKYQEKKLHKLIDHSYRNVPFYHKIMKKSGIHPNDFKKIDDLKHIPVLTKEIVKKNYKNLLSNNFKEFLPAQAHTSGTTGVPLHFYLDQQNREMEYASNWRQILWSGADNVNIKIATFRGDFVLDKSRNPKLFRYNGLQKELAFNVFNIKINNIKKMISKINDYKPALIRGAPQFLSIVAKYASESGCEITYQPNIIQTSSEQCTNDMRDTIENFFGTKVFDTYGQAEYVISFGQCEYGTYHQYMENGIIRLIEDEWGFERLIGTGLWNYSMPFINYDVGDLIRQTKISSCTCNRGLSIVKIKGLQGRVVDIIKTPNQKVLAGGGVAYFWEYRVSPKLHYKPDYLHFIQQKIDEIIIEIHSKKIVTHDLEIMQSELKELLGNEIKIDIKCLSEIPIKENKWRLVESKI